MSRCRGKEFSDHIFCHGNKKKSHLQFVGVVGVMETEPENLAWGAEDVLYDIITKPGAFLSVYITSSW